MARTHEHITAAGEAVGGDIEVLGTTWRDVLRGVAVGNYILLAGFLALSAAEGEFVPFFVVEALIITPGFVLLLKKPQGKAGVIWMGVCSILLSLQMLGFGALAAFQHVESTFTVILLGGMLITNLLGVVAFPGALRRRSSRISEWAPRVVGGLMALIVVVGVVAGLSAGSDARQAGDLVLEADGFEWSDETLEAEAGAVAVFIKSKEGAHHDFTIDGVVEEQIPGFKSRRAEFQVEAGEYRFYCTLHADSMEGTLTVSERTLSR